MKNLNRIIIVCLICSLFLGYACLPVKVEAAAPAIAAYAGLAALFSIISSDFVVVVAEELDDILAEVWYVLSDYCRDLLADMEANNNVVADGRVMSELAPAMNSVMSKYDSVVYKARPNVGSVAVDDLVPVGTKVDLVELPLSHEQLNTIIQNTAATSNLMRSLLAEFQILKYDLTEYIAHIPTSLTALRNQVVDGLGGLSTTLQTFRQNFVNEIIDVKTVVGQFRVAVNDRFSELQYALGVKLGDVNIHLHSIRETLTTRLANIDGLFDIKLSDIKTAVSGFRTQFVEKITDMRTAVGNILTLVKNSVVTGIQDIKTAVNDLTASLSEGLSVSIAGTPLFNSDNEDNKHIGIDRGLVWFGNAGNLFGKFGVGLLAAGAILKEFTDMNFFSSLITISLAIGLVSVFFGIMLDVSSRESSKNIAGKIKSANKQGFNAGFKAGIEKNGG